MLRWVRVSPGQPQRKGSPALQAIGAACLLLGLVLAPLAATVRADHAQEGEASFDASPTLPLFLALTTEGRQTTLRISMRNTGKAAWEPAQGIKLSHIRAPAETYPVERRVGPGQAGEWDLAITPPAAGVISLSYTMVAGSGSFGSPARALLVVLPTLAKPRWDTSALSSHPVAHALLAWGERTLGGPLRSAVAWARETCERALNRPIVLPWRGAAP